MKQHLRVLAAAALLMVTLGSPRAFAADARNDGKSYAGATCQAVSRDHVDNIAYYSAIAWNTSTTSDLVLQCPIVRDTSGGIASGGVAVINRRDDAFVSCILRSYSAPNFEPHRNFDESPPTEGFATLGGTLVQHLGFSGVGQPGDYGYYSLECVVPPAKTSAPEDWSGIVFYWVDEAH